jgi:beta-glucosidase
MEQRIENLIKEMTLEEKVSMTAGADAWHTVAVERLGIPSIKVTDGPHGARGANFGGGGITSACFPAGICMAATWNTDLIRQVGIALGEEARSKEAQVLLGPTVNIHRSPLNGRNFECFSEDPYLSAGIAVAFIRGVKQRHVEACIKHFVCNDAEFERFSINSQVDERALREIYLPAFEAAVTEACVGSVMASYNKINGTYASENPHTLTDILKKEWGFKGFVVSDWGGTRSTVAAANAGLDLEMPGPGHFYGEHLLDAVKTGEVDESVIDDKVRRLLRVIFQIEIRKKAPEDTERAVDLPEHRLVAREAAVEGMVLLKNDNRILPLGREPLTSIAIIGPNARVAQIQGGGSSTVRPHYAVTPYDGIVAKVGDAINIKYEPGCTNHRILPVAEPQWLSPPGDNGKKGLKVEYFNTLDLSGEPVFTSRRTYLDVFWAGPISPDIDSSTFSARFTGSFTPPSSGTYTFGLISTGLSRLFIEDYLVIDTRDDTPTAGAAISEPEEDEILVELYLTKGKAVNVQLDFSTRQVKEFQRRIRLGCLPPFPDDALDRAAKAAGESDIALVFAGTNSEWETEGRDRPDMELPGNQVALIEKVAAANENTVVVLNTGSPISMEWLDRVAAVLQAWFPGQECGNAIADLLFGDANPSGKLPQTFPKRLEENPAFINYPGENGTVRYGEGIFVGYRYYEKKKILPGFAFGHGLSYTTFQFGNLTFSAQEYLLGDEIEVFADVTNTGEREGKEVIQLYIRDPQASLVRPEKELKAFKKILLAPGKTETIRFKLDQRSLSFYNPRRKGWVAEPGIFHVLIGSSSQDIRLTGSFILKDRQTVGKSNESYVNLSMHSSLGDLLGDDRARAILEKHLGHSMASAGGNLPVGISLFALSWGMPHILTMEKLAEVDRELAAL